MSLALARLSLCGILSTILRRPVPASSGFDRKIVPRRLRKLIMPQRLKLQAFGAALVAGALVGGVSYLSDWAFASLNISRASVIANKLMIGVCAAIAAYIWLRYEEECSARIREKTIVIAELNHHIRNAVTLLGQSAALPEGPERSRLIDEAVNRVDRVLTELVPTANQIDEPRLFLKDRPSGLNSKRKQ